MVNRSEHDVSGRSVSVPAEDGVRYVDLYHGVELTPEKEGREAVLASLVIVIRRGERSGSAYLRRTT
jgi:hypothetical protein